MDHFITEHTSFKFYIISYVYQSVIGGLKLSQTSIFTQKIEPKYLLIYIIISLKILIFLKIASEEQNLSGNFNVFFWLILKISPMMCFLMTSSRWHFKSIKYKQLYYYCFKSYNAKMQYNKNNKGKV